MAVNSSGYGVICSDRFSPGTDVPFRSKRRRSYSGGKPGREEKLSEPVPARKFLGGTVPLSEHEQRQLEQIEQALYADYPRFANAVRASDPRVHYKRRIVQAALGFLLGVGTLVAGVVTKNTWIGVAGFVVMLVSSMWALTSYRHMTGAAAGHGPARPKDRRASRRSRAGRPSRATGTGMMERLEERWRRRQERDR
jgi:DUF3040 family protein